MDSMYFTILFCISLSLPLLLWLSSWKNSSNHLPPGPRGWPFIGNILDVGMMPHQNIHKLGAKFGPVIWLKLGMCNTLVVQSAKAAEELFKKHDLQFSDRASIHSSTALNYHEHSIGLAPYGEYLREVRKLSSSELLVPKRVSASAEVRQICINIMMQWIRDDTEASRLNGGSGEIALERYVTLMAFNLVGNFMISRDILGTKSEKGNEFYEAMDKFMEWTGTPNLVDSFPFLKWIDPQGIKRNTQIYMEKLLKIVDGFVKERMQERAACKDNAKEDFLDALLDHNGKGGTYHFSERKVATIVLEMFFAGTETTTSTINWAMAELLRNPKSLSKLENELYQVIGNSRNVEEGDLHNLPYLQAVVHETMRLHPALPLLIPRKAKQDTEYMGYFIPKNTMTLLNVWAIHRDPTSWEDPLSFKPERFMNANVDPKGQHYEFLPFGSGRRSCIGMLLGEKMVSLTLAKLVQSFEWKLPANESPESMDMRERTGIALRKLVPLRVVPVEKKL